MMNSIKGVFVSSLACLLSLCLTPVYSEWNEPSRVLDGCGGWAGNGSYRTVLAAFQPCPIGTAKSDQYVNYSGFLQSFVLRPGLDTDGDGLCDENDLDNDGDRLADDVELAGTAFDPVTATDPQQADSDGDRISDRDESIAGTNPWDENSRLWICDIASVDHRIVLNWQSRKDYRYDVVMESSVTGLVANPLVLDTVTAVNGTNAPWYEGETQYTNVPTGNMKIYRIRVVGK